MGQVYTLYKSKKRERADRRRLVFFFFFFKQTVDIFVRNFSEFAHMVILSLMLFLIFTD